MRKGYLKTETSLSLHIIYNGESIDMFTYPKDKYILSQDVLGQREIVTDESTKIQHFIKMILNNKYYELEEDKINYIINFLKEHNESSEWVDTE